jgi:hypothetical protein
MAKRSNTNTAAAVQAEVDRIEEEVVGMLTEDGEMVPAEDEVASAVSVLKVLTAAEALEQMDGVVSATKSAKIRYLFSLGYKTGDIAKAVGVIYQHARNVINQPLKRATA